MWGAQFILRSSDIVYGVWCDWGCDSQIAHGLGQIFFRLDSRKLEHDVVVIMLLFVSRCCRWRRGSTAVVGGSGNRGLLLLWFTCWQLEHGYLVCPMLVSTSPFCKTRFRFMLLIWRVVIVYINRWTQRHTVCIDVCIDDEEKQKGHCQLSIVSLSCLSPSLPLPTAVSQQRQHHVFWVLPNSFVV